MLSLPVDSPVLGAKLATRLELQGRRTGMWEEVRVMLWQKKNGKVEDILLSLRRLEEKDRVVRSGGRGLRTGLVLLRR